MIGKVRPELLDFMLNPSGVKYDGCIEFRHEMNLTEIPFTIGFSNARCITYERVVNAHGKSTRIILSPEEICCSLAGVEVGTLRNKPKWSN
jgi:hypothetical protein